MNPSHSGNIAWEALDEIYRDVEGFLRTVADMPDLRRSSGSSTGGAGEAAAGQEGASVETIAHLRREVERLQKQLDESANISSSWINKPETRKRLRALEMDPDERPFDAGVARLEQQLQEEQLMRVRERERLMAKVAELEGEGEKMVRKIKFLTTEEQNSHAKVKETSARHLQEKASLQEEVLAKNRRAQSLEGELEELRRELTDLRRRSGQYERHQQELQRRDDLISRLEANVVRLNKEVSAKEQAETELVSLRRRLEEETRRHSQLQEQGGGGQGEDPGYVTRLQAKVVELERLLKRRTSELETLQAERGNTMLKEEKLRSLEAAKTRLERQVESLVEIESKYDTMMNEKRVWDKTFEALLKDSGIEVGDGATTTTKVMKVIRRAQDRVAELLAEKSEEISKNAALTRQLADSERRASEDGKRILDLEEKVTQLESTMQDNDGYIKVVKDENKALKELLDSYDKDLAGPLGMDKQGQPDSLRCPSPVTARVRELERLLGEAQEELRVVKERSQTYIIPEIYGNSKARVASLEGEVKRLEQEKAQLGRRLESIESELARHESFAAQGAFNPDTTRVLHVTENPTTVALHGEIRRLRAENQALKSGGGQEVLGSPREDTPGPSGLSARRSSSMGPGDTSLDAAMAAASGGGQSEGGVDVRVYYKRLKEMFRDRTKFYRDMVYRLTGFNITLKEGKDPQVQLKSSFMEFEADSILIEVSSDDKLNLLDTPFIKRQDKRLLLNLQQWNSYPAFLAALQLDLFEKQTFQG